jgi:hypothetical protein
MLVKEKKNKMDARGSDDGPEFSKSPDCKKNKPPGRKITLKINKWALLKETACNQNEIYNIPLPRGPGPKNKTQKKTTKVG